MSKESITYEESVDIIARQEVEELKVIVSFDDLEAAIGRANARNLKHNVNQAFQAKAAQRIEVVADLFSVSQDALTENVRARCKEIIEGSVEEKA
ncbi:MAG: hypothetical protein HFJ65_03265 [Eggerthellaceae bacterium]|nr:hypothetical protein [Eggerthellaceae bacterium]